MTINGAKPQSYGYSEAQCRALGALLRARATALPRVGVGAPRDARGEVLPHTVEDLGDVEGRVAHWNLSLERWDPGPGMDWDRVDQALKSGPAGK